MPEGRSLFGKDAAARGPIPTPPEEGAGSLSRVTKFPRPPAPWSTILHWWVLMADEQTRDPAAAPGKRNSAARLLRGGICYNHFKGDDAHAKNDDHKRSPRGL